MKTFYEIANTCPWRDVDTYECSARIDGISPADYVQKHSLQKAGCIEEGCAVFHFLTAILK